jgi:hypothetical protein
MINSAFTPAPTTNNYVSPFAVSSVQNPYITGSTVNTSSMTVDKLTVGGLELSEFIKNVNQRLAILSPDIEKLAHFQALRIAYDNYRAVEALCALPINK